MSPPVPHPRRVDWFLVRAASSRTRADAETNPAIKGAWLVAAELWESLAERARADNTGTQRKG